MNLVERASYKAKLRSESMESSKIIVELQAYQSSSNSIKIYKDISQFFSQPLENVYDLSDLFEQLISSPFFYISTDQLFSILEVAMIRNDTDLVEKMYSRFSFKELDQRKFATPRRLKKLYISQMTSIKEDSLADNAGLGAWLAEDCNEFKYDGISKLILKFESSLISTNWNPFANFERQDPEERLFCWALLFEFWDLANLIWLRSKYGIGLAILGATFLRGAAALKRRDISG
jgi:hypothetical protein